MHLSNCYQRVVKHDKINACMSGDRSWVCEHYLSVCHYLFHVITSHLLIGTVGALYSCNRWPENAETNRVKLIFLSCKKSLEEGSSGLTWWHHKVLRGPDCLQPLLSFLRMWLLTHGPKGLPGFQTSQPGSRQQDRGRREGSVHTLF